MMTLPQNPMERDPEFWDKQDYVAGYIRRRRVTAGLTQVELSAQLKVNRTAVTKYEGSKIPHVSCAMMYWLLHDERLVNADYWRERALKAERTLEAIAKVLPSPDRSQT
jgi:transcriptional regulator with XRE-family HTH domain